MEGVIAVYPGRSNLLPKPFNRGWMRRLVLCVLWLARTDKSRTALVVIDTDHM